jgi:hypothetical protein
LTTQQRASSAVETDTAPAVDGEVISSVGHRLRCRRGDETIYGLMHRIMPGCHFLAVVITDSSG